jgi:hypothetical protein
MGWRRCGGLVLLALATCLVALAIPFDSAGRTQARTWSGTWNTLWGGSSTTMTLTQTGSSVSGGYTWDNGAIKGTVQGDLLTGTWTETPTRAPPNDAGEIRFTLGPAGRSFTGQWRYGKAGDPWKPWSGTCASGACLTNTPSAAKPPPAPPTGKPIGLGIDYSLKSRFGERGPNGLVRYFKTEAEIKPSTFEVDLVVTRKDGRPCRPLADRIALSANGRPLTPNVLERVSVCTFRAKLAEGTYLVKASLNATDGLKGTGERTVVVQDWLIFGLGDSNGSGEGTPDVPLSVATGVEWQSTICDRSANSYQAQAALRLEQGDPRTSVTFVHIACSGASVEHGLLGTYPGINPGGPALLPQLDQMKFLRRGREIDAVILSIGVNDLEFGKFVAHCISYDNCPQSKWPGDPSKTVAQTIADKLKVLREKSYPRLAAALEKLVPADRVYITEYFDSTHLDGTSFCAPLIHTVTGGLFDGAEAKWAYEHLLVPLNKAVAEAAANYHWHLVAGAQKEFGPHGYCSPTPWIVGLRESLLNQANANGTLHATVVGNGIQSDLVVPQVRAGFYKGGRTRRPAP